jgi:hypothetical protein
LCEKTIIDSHILDQNSFHLAFCDNQSYVRIQKEYSIVKPITVHVVLLVRQCFVSCLLVGWMGESCRGNTENLAVFRN